MNEHEILFRGKRTDCEAWVEGDLLHYESGEMAICKGFSKYGYEATEIIGRYKVLPETVGQYTGLTDKNGKRIFEGDIIQSLESSVTGLVQWFPEHSAFMVWCKSANVVGFLYECADIIKVIGNIHDNPELLEGDTQ